jgi:hypothetical protein
MLRFLLNYYQPIGIFLIIIGMFIEQLVFECRIKTTCEADAQIFAVVWFGGITILGIIIYQYKLRRKK